MSTKYIEKNKKYKIAFSIFDWDDSTKNDK
jgi:hypothetical protein